MDGLRHTGFRAGRRTCDATRTSRSVRRGMMPDLLSVSLSTTDAVGHAFGPDSREIHDQVLRVDRWLGAFIDSLQHEIGSEIAESHGFSTILNTFSTLAGRGKREVGRGG